MPCLSQFATAVQVVFRFFSRDFTQLHGIRLVICEPARMRVFPVFESARVLTGTLCFFE